MRAAGLFALALVAACGGEPSGLDGSPPVFAGGTSGRTADAALVGSWARLVIVPDAGTGTSASETRWTFQADGRAERRVVTRNLTLGLGDVVVARGTWYTEPDGSLVVTLDDGSVRRFAYQVQARLDGSILTLDGLSFESFAAT